LNEPPQIKKHIDSYREDIDSVQTFIQEALVPGTKKDRIAVSHLNMYHNNSYNNIDKVKFSQRLKSVLNIEKYPRYHIDGSKQNCIVGYKINPEFTQEEEEP